MPASIKTRTVLLFSQHLSLFADKRLSGASFERYKAKLCNYSHWPLCRFFTTLFGHIEEFWIFSVGFPKISEGMELVKSTLADGAYLCIT